MNALSLPWRLLPRRWRAEHVRERRGRNVLGRRAWMGQRVGLRRAPQPPVASRTAAREGQRGRKRMRSSVQRRWCRRPAHAAARRAPRPIHLCAAARLGAATLRGRAAAPPAGPGEAGPSFADAPVSRTARSAAKRRFVGAGVAAGPDEATHCWFRLPCLSQLQGCELGARRLLSRAGDGSRSAQVRARFRRTAGVLGVRSPGLSFYRHPSESAPRAGAGKK